MQKPLHFHDGGSSFLAGPRREPQSPSEWPGPAEKPSRSEADMSDRRRRLRRLRKLKSPDDIVRI